MDRTLWDPEDYDPQCFLSKIGDAEKVSSDVVHDNNYAWASFGSGLDSVPPGNSLCSNNASWPLCS